MNQTKEHSMSLNDYVINGKKFKAENCVDGVLINPSQPKMFDCTANEDRPATQKKWWYLPYIVTETVEQLDKWYANRKDEYAEGQRKMWAESGRQEWMKAWPSGSRYEVRCLDGGAWDRSTSWGMFGSVDEALQCAATGPAHRRR
jgi:hypothetical protein